MKESCRCFTLLCQPVLHVGIVRTCVLVCGSGIRTRNMKGKTKDAIHPQIIHLPKDVLEFKNA